MSNRLKVAMIDIVLSLHHRDGPSAESQASWASIVRQSLRRARAAPKPAIAPSGSSDLEITRAWIPTGKKTANRTTGLSAYFSL
jgi:hypothetical protein